MGNCIGAKEKNIDKPSCVNLIENVYIGVFFDGTNNNMVQQAYFHTYNLNKIDDNECSNLQNAQVKFAKCIIATQDKKSDKKLISKTFDSLTREQRIELLKSLQIDTPIDSFDSTLFDNLSTKEKKELLESLQVHTHVDEKMLHQDTEQGYSNIAILHSLIKQNDISDNAIYYNLYIEGSGAKDIANSYGNTSYMDEANTNGLGFGLGKTGVTALVSKAIKYIRLFLISNGDKINEQTNYHFGVFGFSRGATCARLFTELATRPSGKRLKREDEFGQSTSKIKDLYKKFNRVPFMETGFLGDKIIINRNKVTVDFLGIYDTVASIGFLKQKDGWTNVLSLGYRVNIFGNYNGNFHYKNARDYGLYSHHNENVKNTLHICAADEFRENFALVNLGKKIPTNAKEIIIPGCHSDVGGGYVAKKSILFILYKIITRKKQRAIKAWGNLKPILSSLYPSAATIPNSDELLMSEKHANIFTSDPMFPPKESSISPLNAETLIKLGWIDKNYSSKNLEVYDELHDISFNRDEKQGYSNIPLKMMLKSVKNCGINWLINFFNDDLSVYAVPDELKEKSDKMCNHAKTLDGKRVWLIPKGGYSGFEYRNLRLKFLHFSSSCEIFNEGITNPNLGNFGNNCNYDDDVNICRIMYMGDELLEGKKNHEDNVHYMYEYSNYNIIADEI